MRVIIKNNYDECSLWAAHYVAYKIKAFRPTPEKPFVLGLPTGSTPLGMYQRLIEMVKAQELSFANVVTFNMDEYIGLPPEHPQSYHYFMHENFFKHIDIRPENINILNGMTTDFGKECAEYEEKSADTANPFVYRRRGRRRTHCLQRAGIVSGFPHQGKNADPGYD